MALADNGSSRERDINGQAAVQGRKENTVCVVLLMGWLVPKRTIHATFVFLHLDPQGYTSAKKEKIPRETSREHRQSDVQHRTTGTFKYSACPYCINAGIKRAWMVIL